jgi:hypothetical protein
MCNSIVALWYFLVGVTGTLEHANMVDIAKAATQINVGANEDDVLRLLGKPYYEYELNQGWSILGIGAHPRQWLYGTTINLMKLLVSDDYLMISPLPINIRLISYEQDDLRMEWDSKGKVAKITVPNLEMDPRTEQMTSKILDVIYSLNRVWLTVLDRSLAK